MRVIGQLLEYDQHTDLTIEKQVAHVKDERSPDQPWSFLLLRKVKESR